MTTDTAAQTPLTDAVLREAIAKHGRGEYADNEINADLTKHARSLEAQLADKCAEFERVNKQLEYVCGTLEITLQRAERAEQDAAQMRQDLMKANALNDYAERRLLELSNKLEKGDAMQLNQEELFAALMELTQRIEACGASVELTHAVTLCSDIRGAVGNKWNPADPYAADRVRTAIAAAERSGT